MTRWRDVWEEEVEMEVRMREEEDKKDEMKV